jgi:uncharacterized protein
VTSTDPWAPAPLRGPIVAAQHWRDVTFVHWRVDPAIVAPLLPRGIAPDVIDGASWAGLIAFELSGARVAGFGTPASWGSFTEVNVRLYGVDARGRRGVVFKSLEAASLPAVVAARALFSIPYRWARTAQRSTPTGIEYAAQRIVSGGRVPRFRLGVEMDRATTVDDEQSRFLTARWGLYQERFGSTRWMPNRHAPWLLHPARVVRLRDDLLAAAGLPGIAHRHPDSVLFSPGVWSEFGMPRRA